MSSLRLGESKLPTRSATVGWSSMAPSVLPQRGQKARLDQSEERQVAGGPPGPVQATASLGNSTQAAVKAPVWRWHMRQEQVCGFRGGPLASKRMAPHRQPPG